MPSLIRYLCASAFLASGAALVATVVIKIHLAFSLGILVSLALVIVWRIWRSSHGATRELLQRRFKIGLYAGVFATFAYDLSRYLLVTLFPFSLWPFEAIPLFGKLLLGNWFSGSILLVTGILYHALNGIAFGIAYSILFAPRGWWAGILWAMGLETLMLLVYPQWLSIKFIEEFVTVSVIGHVAYGSVLGNISRHLYLKNRAIP